MTQPPFWFYAAAAVALVWNIMGVVAIGINLSMTPEQVASLTVAQQTLYEATPIWSIVASVTAVVSGSLGCAMLLFKKPFAYHLFIVSGVALIIQDISLFLVLDAVSTLGSGPLIMQSLVFIIAIGLLIMAKYSIKQQWLR